MNAFMLLCFLNIKNKLCLNQPPKKKETRNSRWRILANIFVRIILKLKVVPISGLQLLACKPLTVCEHPMFCGRQHGNISRI